VIIVTESILSTIILLMLVEFHPSMTNVYNLLLLINHLKWKLFF